MRKFRVVVPDFKTFYPKSLGQTLDLMATYRSRRAYYEIDYGNGWEAPRD